MKHNILSHICIVAAMAAIFALHGCESHDFHFTEADGEILQLSAAVGAPDSRFTDNVETLDLDVGDAVGVLVFEDGTYKGNFKYVKQPDATWNTSGRFYRLPKEEKPMQYVVYAPYQANFDFAATYDDAINSLKAAVYPKKDQHTKELYRACDLLTAGLTSYTSTTTKIEAHLEHEYAVVCVYGLSNFTYVLINDREIVYKNIFKSIEIKLDSDEYTPFYNDSDFGGDDCYRVIVPLGTGTIDNFYLRITAEGGLTDVEKEVEKSNLPIKKNEMFYYSLDDDPTAASFAGIKKESELTDEEKIGSIVCVDETIDPATGEPRNHVVLVPRSIFKFSKYSIMKLRPVGVMFSTQTSDEDQAHGWTRGYAISLRCAGATASNMQTQPTQYPLVNTHIFPTPSGKQGPNVDFDFLESRYDGFGDHNNTSIPMTDAEKEMYKKVCTFLNGYKDMQRVKAYCTDNGYNYEAKNLATVKNHPVTGDGSTWPAVWVAEHFGEEDPPDATITDEDGSVKGRFWLPKGPTTDKHSSGWYLISAGQCIQVVKGLGHFGDAEYYGRLFQFAWDAGSTTSFSENFDDQMAYVDMYMEYDGAVVIPKEDQTTVPKFWQRLNPKRVTGGSGGYDMNIVTLGICRGRYGEWNLLCWDMEINYTKRTGIGGWLSESISHFVRPVFAF